jgi:hypothetical protein
VVAYGALHLLGGFAASNVTTFLTCPETISEAAQAHWKNAAYLIPDQIPLEKISAEGVCLPLTPPRPLSGWLLLLP